MKLRGERLTDDRGRLLDYWRVEKADSAIALPRWDGRFWLPPPVYRPGLGQATLDFPGGRLPAATSPAAAVPAIVGRELGLEAGAIARLEALNDEGWPVNSSFSNQRLYGFLAELDPAADPTLGGAAIAVPASPDGARSLLARLTCLQCRALLLEWLVRQG